MNRIHLLPESISGRIAAGEVVNNPASVVKELVENSIDAGATAVTVEIIRGGMDRIRVTDNGYGIHPDDMLIAVEKHATSKISSFDDISSITTLGYRGEALASIIAVSNVEIRSQMPDMDEGRIFSNSTGGGNSIKPAGLPAGTTVIADNLFYNIPARRKFLKSPAHETANVTDLMSRLIMSCPRIAFRYISNNKTVFHSPGNGALKDAITSIYGTDISSKLLKVAHTAPDISVTGFVSGVNTQYKTSKYQSIFINGRYILSKKLSESVNAAYTERLLKGHFPLAVIHITVPPDSLDVNIHPGKMSVLCDNAAEIENNISTAIRNILDVRRIPKVDMQKIAYGHIRNNTEEYLPEKETVKPGSSLFSGKTNSGFMQFNDSASIFDTDSCEAAENDIEKTYYNKHSYEEFNNVLLTYNSDNSGEKPEEIKGESMLSDFFDYSIIGTAFNTYLILQAEDKLYYIDQHAAHERLNYERLKNQITVSSRILLRPFTLNLNAHDHNILVENSPFLESLGFELEDFGGTSIKVSAVPNIIDHRSIQPLIEDIICILNDIHSDKVLLRDRIIKKACRISVKAGDTLSNAEIDALIKELLSSGTIPTCPHGRPVAVVVTKSDLEKTFKRRV